MTAKKYRFVAQTQTDGQVDRVFDSSEMVNAYEYEGLEERLKVCQSLREHERTAAEARIAQLEAALGMMYDKWENGEPICELGPDDAPTGSFLGNAFKLTEAEENNILSLIPATAQETPVNQCDGCRQGLPINISGNHTDIKGWPIMTCTKYRYEAKTKGE